MLENHKKCTKLDTYKNLYIVLKTIYMRLSRNSIFGHSMFGNVTCGFSEYVFGFDFSILNIRPAVVINIGSF